MKAKKSTGPAKKDFPIDRKMSPKMKRGNQKAKQIKFVPGSDNNAQKIGVPQKQKSMMRVPRITEERNGDTMSVDPNLFDEVIYETEQQTLKRKAGDSSGEDEKSEISSPAMKKRNRIKKRNKASGEQNKGTVTPNASGGVQKAELAIAHLKQWKEDHGNWKFNKARQVWLNERWMDSAQISDDLFPVWLEYVKGGADSQKKLLVAKATMIIEEQEKENATIKLDEKYQRAKEVIQSLSVAEEESSE